MHEFNEAYQQLNPLQKQAVDTIEGPLLVLAGPGTGKTQLLSARVANILRQTDALPQNILCLTFTESGAQNMRERLVRFIGKAGHEVQISTYHAFGSDIITRYPEYFTELRLQTPVDELTKYMTLQEIVLALPYSHPIKQTQYHLNDLIATISELKRALLRPKDVRDIAAHNQLTITDSSREVARIFANHKSMPRKPEIALSLFTTLHAALDTLTTPPLPEERFKSLQELAISSLEQALSDAAREQSTKPLTAWKNNWLAKDADNNFVLAGKLENQRLTGVAQVLEQYQKQLQSRGMYDFDDMIIESLSTLEQNPELKYTLQERYLYLLLDEFQDTNAAQLRLVELLTDNPVHEGRPNVMAVGDDDQAIYAFQGAQYSNMLDFYAMYRDVAIVNLTDNYRSHPAVLHTASKIVAQIGARLQDSLPDIDKRIQGANSSLGSGRIRRIESASDVAQYDWIASEIEHLITEGAAPKEIAVLAPKHRLLEPMLSHLNQRGIPVRYEKRENILETPVILDILRMSRLLVALQSGDEATARSLWPQVLSAEYWQIPISTLWKLSWRVTREDTTWSEAVLEEPACHEPAQLLLSLALKIDTEGCESILDYLVGISPVETNDPDRPTVSSPIKNYYLKIDTAQEAQTFYDTLSHLRVMRQRLREYQHSSDTALKLQDLLQLVDMYEAAGQPMVNTSPYNQHANAVQLMTVYKAKGLEFEHVFLPTCHDDVWGNSSRGNANKLTLPKNLEPIRHAGANEDERLRLFFVAITRAKRGLYLCSYKSGYDGKATKRLKYLDEQEDDAGQMRSLVLPKPYQHIEILDTSPPSIEALMTDWRHRHHPPTTDMHALLHERLTYYKLSPSHLNTFIDTEYGGPQEFYLHTLLRFPKAPSPQSRFGSAIHDALEWMVQQVSPDGEIPETNKVVHRFALALKRQRLDKLQYELELDRGSQALGAYIAARRGDISRDSRSEVNFARSGIIIDGIRMTGKIDRIDIDQTTKQITVVDYKTGTPHPKWKRDIKLHKYRQQLYCYKSLIEHAPEFRGYSVTTGQLDFVEPDRDGRIHSLKLTFDETELQRVQQLLKAVWQHIFDLNFPDISAYPATMKGVDQLEQDLLDGKL